jgi:hypothetical protein
VPTEPPICWDVFTMAEAMPASFGATPSVAAENIGAKMQPIPEHQRFDAGALDYAGLDGCRGDDEHDGKGQERQAGFER